jgi:NTE family protein
MRTGVALGGGGAKGLAHIGVLKVLHEHGIVPDLVSGTSIGALVGALYLRRGDIALVEAFALGFEGANITPYLAPRPSGSGLVSEKRIRAFLDQTLGPGLIEELDRPFFCPATDIRSGREVMLERGPLALAVRASISVPVIFRPVRIGGGYLVDGGLVNPVPVDVLKRGGAEFTVAVNIITPPSLNPRRRPLPRGKEKLLLARLDRFFSRRLLNGGQDHEPNLVESFLSTMEIMQERLIAARLLSDAPDAVIHVDTSDYKFFEFYRPAELIRRGEEAARLAIKDVLRRKRAAQSRVG